MRRLFVLVVVLACGLAAASPALAAPHLSPAMEAKVSGLVDRFVKDVVERQNLDSGWALAGPYLKGGTTRAAWDKGRGVSVEEFHAHGSSFRNSWTLNFVTPTEIGLTVTLHVGHGAGRETVAEAVSLDKLHGAWIFQAFYPNGIFRQGGHHEGSCATSKCKVTGLNDFAPGGQGSGGSTGAVPAGNSQGRWAVLALGVGAAVVVATVLGLVWHFRRRDRRAREAYLATRS